MCCAFSHVLLLFFFFKQKTAYEMRISDWSSDVCSSDLQHPWRRIRAKAGLDDVRIHDLRHSYASGALALGEGLPMIGKLLGHTQVQTTARYAHQIGRASCRDRVCQYG